MKLAISVTGLEETLRKNKQAFERSLQNLNLYRDYFVKSNYTVLFWVNEVVAKELSIKAPDFWRARTKIIVFKPKRETFVERLEEYESFPSRYVNYQDLKRREDILESLIRSLNPSFEKDRIPYVALSFTLSNLKRLLGDYQQARDILDTCLSILKDSDNESIRLECLLGLAHVNFSLGQYTNVEKYAKEALKISNETSNDYNKARVLSILGKVAFNKRELDTAKDYLNKSLDLLKERSGNDSLKAAIYNSLSGIAFRQDDLKVARSLLEESLKLTNTKNESTIVGIFTNLGILDAASGDIESAVNNLRKALDIAEKFGMRSAIAGIYHELGLLEQDKNDSQKAEEYLQKALKIRKENSELPSVAITLAALGGVYAKQGKVEQAVENLLESARLLHELKSKDEEYALSDVGAVISSIGSKKFAEILDKCSNDVKSYVVELLEKIDKTSEEGSEKVNKANL